MILRMGDKEVDLTRAFPLNLGDIMSLEELGVMDEKGEMNASSPVKMGKLLLHLAQKVDTTITLDDIKKIDLDKFDEIGSFFEKKLGETGVKRPTSKL